MGNIIQWSCENFEMANEIRNAHQGRILSLLALKRTDRNYNVWSAGKDNVIRIWDSEVFENRNNNFRIFTA
jgi:hypothetical protein